MVPPELKVDSQGATGLCVHPTPTMPSGDRPRVHPTPTTPPGERPRVHPTPTMPPGDRPLARSEHSSRGFRGRPYWTHDRGSPRKERGGQWQQMWPASCTCHSPALERLTSCPPASAVLPAMGLAPVSAPRGLSRWQLPPPRSARYLLKCKASWLRLSQVQGAASDSFSCFDLSDL